MYVGGWGQVVEKMDLKRKLQKEKKISRRPRTERQGLFFIEEASKMGNPDRKGQDNHRNNYK
jgi:hypothetical protein